MKRNEDLVRLAKFNNPIQAHSMRIMLEANGIPAFVVGDAIQEIGMELIQVLVTYENLELARRVITEVPAASEVLIPEWVCVCGEQVDSGFHLCWSCGRAHEDFTD